MTQTPASRRVGFIGLGNMGGPMAANLRKAGHSVTGFDLVPTALAAAEAAGIAIAPDAASAAQGQDFVVTMLPAGKHVREVYEVLVGAASPGTVLIDCSTIDVADARAAQAIAAGAGLAAADAPVSGGVGGAEAATLTFMVGAADTVFATIQPLLAAMGRKIVHCGPGGSGQAAKLCNNMILGVSMIAVAEAFVLGEQLGLSHAALFQVASASSGQCWALTSNCPVPDLVPTSPANRDYRPGFAAGLMLKDLSLARDAAASSGAETELGRHAAEIYARFNAEGGGGQDFSAIVNDIRRRSRRS